MLSGWRTTRRHHSAVPARLGLAANWSVSNTENVRTTTDEASAAIADGEAEAQAPDLEWRHWNPQHDASQPIMDRLLTERGGIL
jgi:hypothetical protein